MGTQRHVSHSVTTAALDWRVVERLSKKKKRAEKDGDEQLVANSRCLLEPTVVNNEDKMQREADDEF